MATKRISELPAKGSAIGATDLVEISEPDGLGGYVSKRVTGAQLGSDTNFANTNLTLTGNRTHDLNSYLLKFNNGQFEVDGSTGMNIVPDGIVPCWLTIQSTDTKMPLLVNSTSSANAATFYANTGYAVVASGSGTAAVYGLNNASGSGVLGASTNGNGGAFTSSSQAAVSGISTSNYGGNFSGASGVIGSGTTYGVVGYASGTGGYFYSSGGGYGVIPYENSGSAGAMNCQGKALFNGTAATGSALVQVDSTTQGVLLPRMTTAQKNAISTPATGLVVFDTTLNRYEFYNGSAWVAYYTDPDGWTTIVKSANQDVTNNATPQDDTELQFTVVAGAFYTVKMHINISANNLTGDYAGRFFVSAGTMKGNGVVTSLSATGTASVQLQNANSVANTAIFQTGSIIADIDQVIPCTIIYSFTPSSNATFSFQFSNAAAAAGRTSRTWKDSILKYKRID